MIYRNPNSTPSFDNRNMNIAGVNYANNPEAEYGEHIKNTTAICNTSASHTYGHVMAIMEKYILDQFEGIDFKTVTASTTLASRQLRHLPQQLHKVELPAMVLVPRIMFGQDDNRFLANTLINSRVTNTHSYWGEGSLLPLAEDKKKKLYIHGHYNRAVMYIDIVLSFNTYAEQLNCMSAIWNNLPVGHNKFIQAPLELYIPDKFCKLISELVDIPINENESVYKFMTYMNSIWNYPITYKLKGGSNSDEFFMYYIADIDTLIQEPQAGQGIKDGQTRRGFDVSFTVRCEFNTVGYFTLDKPELQKQIHIPSTESQTIVPIFSDVINLNDFDLPIGWSILSWPIFKLAYNENTISIDSILNQSLRVVIDHHLKFGIPMSRFINIQFRENGEILSDEAYYINWAKRELVLSNPNYRRTYRLIITVSHEYVNNLIKQLYKLE